MPALKLSREAIDKVLCSWETAFPHANNFRIIVVRDTTHDRYLVLEESWQKSVYEEAILIHLEIREDKIWILQNNTSDEIGKLLLQEGIARQDIVIGFLPSHLRSQSDYGTA